MIDRRHLPTSRAESRRPVKSRRHQANLTCPLHKRRSVRGSAGQPCVVEVTSHYHSPSVSIHRRIRAHLDPRFNHLRGIRVRLHQPKVSTEPAVQALARRDRREVDRYDSEAGRPDNDRQFRNHTISRRVAPQSHDPIYPRRLEDYLTTNRSPLGVMCHRRHQHRRTWPESSLHFSHQKGRGGAVRESSVYQTEDIDIVRNHKVSQGNRLGQRQPVNIPGDDPKATLHAGKAPYFMVKVKQAIGHHSRLRTPVGS